LILVNLGIDGRSFRVSQGIDGYGQRSLRPLMIEATNHKYIFKLDYASLLRCFIWPLIRPHVFQIRGLSMLIMSSGVIKIPLSEMP
jgi:hypothetical protein